VQTDALERECTDILDHKKPVHYNQYFAFANVGEVENDLVAVAYQLEWNWVNAASERHCDVR